MGQGEWAVTETQREREPCRESALQILQHPVESCSQPTRTPQKGTWMNHFQPLSPPSLQSSVHWPNSTRSQRTKEPVQALYPSYPHPGQEIRWKWVDVQPGDEEGERREDIPHNSCMLLSIFFFGRNINESGGERMPLYFVAATFQTFCTKNLTLKIICS